MARTRKAYTPEFKLQAVKMILEQKRPVAKVARRLDAGEDRLHTWKRRSASSRPRSSAWRRSATS